MPESFILKQYGTGRDVLLYQFHQDETGRWRDILMHIQWCWKSVWTQSPILGIAQAAHKPLVDARYINLAQKLKAELWKLLFRFNHAMQSPMVQYIGTPYVPNKLKRSGGKSWRPNTLDMPNEPEWPGRWDSQTGWPRALGIASVPDWLKW